MSKPRPFCALQLVSLVPLTKMTMTTVMMMMIGCFFCPWTSARAATDPGEVTSLQVIAGKLNITKWNFSVDPCTRWTNSVAPYIECDFGSSPYHVTMLYLFNLSLVGQLPSEVANFSRLTQLRMGLNLLTGTIPRGLGRLSKLSVIDLGINQLTGPLPSEIGNLTSLTSLGVGANKLSGSLPEEIGKLLNLQSLYIDASGISGEIPVQFRNLNQLNTVWMFGTPLSGHFPDVFQNMSKLLELRLYGNNLTGPIPASLLALPTLSTLSIGDLVNGGSIPASFKALRNLEYLSLRHNQLNGQIPEDLGSLTLLQYLDLSFNNLSGEIPASLGSLSNLKSLFLGNNSLEGSLPMTLDNVAYLTRLDVSYNKLSGSIPTWINRSSLEANLLWNFLDQSNQETRLTSAAFNCLDTKSPCDRTSSGNNVGFSINCGGPEVQTVFYSADSETVGDASFFVSTDGTWGVSQTGYQPVNQASETFYSILSSSTKIQGFTDEAIYQTARGSANSLKYYGLDMKNGNYEVELYFSEIAIPADGTWESLGRRIFDVYIQGSKVLEDFNIRASANGSFIPVVKKFSTTVTKNVLEIHFLWSGKGTCCLPTRWTYGPLVSAIRVTDGSKSAASKRQLTVILSSVLAALLVTVSLCWALQKNLRKSFSRTITGVQQAVDTSEFSSLEEKLHIFTYSELKAATEDFHTRNKLGKGGFGAVFKGCLQDGTIVAVKQLNSETEKGITDFMNEVATISAVQHRNLVQLIGCCIQGKKKFLVFEYLENNSLSQCLLEKKLFLDWRVRFNICVGIARGLMYLHEESRTRIIHRDIKASNILLDQNLNPKIADFGLAKLFQDNRTHISTRVAGTIGYLAPEYALRGKLTEKADVYSFGILLLEIVSGRSHHERTLPAEMVYLLEWTWQLYDEDRLLELADASLRGKFSPKEVLKVIHVALLCTQALPTSRPKMSGAHAMLTGSSEIVLNITRPAFLSDLTQKPHPVGTSSTATTSSSSTGAHIHSHVDQTMSLLEPR